jgi:transcription termination factor Rho
MYDILELSKKLVPELREIAKELKIKKAESLKKQDLVYKILDQQAIETIETTEPETIEKKEIASINTSEENLELDLAKRVKRPRTFLPRLNNTKESVMTVSPDGIKRNDTKPIDKQEAIGNPENVIEERDNAYRGSHQDQMKDVIIQKKSNSKQEKDKIICLNPG